MKIITGDLIQLAKQGQFDVIGHGSNCFCTMKSGIAVPFAKEFGCNAFPLESREYYGDISKLGEIDYMHIKRYNLYVVNMYTQYLHGDMSRNMQVKGIPLSYRALTSCLMKLAFKFGNSRIGLPLIGCGRAGGDWNKVQQLIQKHMDGVDVTIVKLIE
jgi:O-acetyl-ADP-ribose deacetylase (regulator of RNase III)